MKFGKSILKYIESEGFNFSWYIEMPINDETSFLGVVLSDEQRKEIVLNAWYTGKLVLDDKRYIVALLMANYELFGKDQKEYGFKINSIQEIANIDREVVELADEIVANKIILSR